VSRILPEPTLRLLLPIFCRRNFRKTFSCYLTTPPAELLHWTLRLPGIGNRTSDSYRLYHRFSLGSSFSDALGHPHYSTSRTDLSYPPSQERTPSRLIATDVPFSGLLYPVPRKSPTQLFSTAIQNCSGLPSTATSYWYSGTQASPRPLPRLASPRLSLSLDSL